MHLTYSKSFKNISKLQLMYSINAHNSAWYSLHVFGDVAPLWLITPKQSTCVRWSNCNALRIGIKYLPMFNDFTTTCSYCMKIGNLHHLICIHPSSVWEKGAICLAHYIVFVLNVNMVWSFELLSINQGKRIHSK